MKSHTQAAHHLMAVIDHYEGKKLDQLPEVSEAIIKASAKLAPATIRQRISLVRAACRHMWKVKRLDMPDPASHITLPKVSNERHEYLGRPDALRLARKCESREARALILIAFYSGMRNGEIRAAEVVDNLYVLRDSKNGKPRIVPVHHKVRQYSHRLPPKISYRSMMIWFRKAADAIGRPELHFHDLRHSTASAMIQAGESLFTVGQVLGHTSARSTQRYAHLVTENLAAALNRIARKNAA